MLTQAAPFSADNIAVKKRRLTRSFLTQSAVLLFSMANSLWFTFLMIKTCFCFF